MCISWLLLIMPISISILTKIADIILLSLDFEILYLNFVKEKNCVKNDKISCLSLYCTYHTAK